MKKRGALQGEKSEKPVFHEDTYKKARHYNTIFLTAVASSVKNKIQ